MLFNHFLIQQKIFLLLNQNVLKQKTENLDVSKTLHMKSGDSLLHDLATIGATEVWISLINILGNHWCYRGIHFINLFGTHGSRSIDLINILGNHGSRRIDLIKILGNHGSRSIDFINIVGNHWCYGGIDFIDKYTWHPW